MSHSPRDLKLEKFVQILAKLQASQRYMQLQIDVLRMHTGISGEAAGTLDEVKDALATNRESVYKDLRELKTILEEDSEVEVG